MAVAVGVAVAVAVAVGVCMLLSGLRLAWVMDKWL